MEGYTNFTKVYANEIKGLEIIASDAIKLSGSLISTNVISKADNYSLSTTEKAKVVTVITMTAESKVLTLGLAEGQTMILYNKGSETVKIKNISGDTGTDVATTKSVLVIGSTTANTSIIIALN